MKKLQNLAWIDLEMTGLVPEKDVIVEIASIVTDKDLNIIAEGPNFIIYQPDAELIKMEDFVKNLHTKSGLLPLISSSTTTIQEAEMETIKFFDEFCFAGVVPLCGNSIWQDRRFLRQHMPRLDNFFNYRIIDVSSVKEIIKRWYPNSPQLDFQKKEMHRALSDIRESIAELSYYKRNFFINEGNDEE